MDQELDHIVARWIDCDSRARIVVDGDLTVYWVSSSAEALMSNDKSVLRRNGRLRPRDPRLERELRTFVDGATSEVSTQCIANPQSGEHIVLTAIRLQSPWEHLVGVTMHRAGEDFDVRLVDLHQAFGLTPTEGRVAHRLLCGKTADETADDLGVSLDTVRTHIKRAYGKLGVSSREGFFHKLAPFVIAMG